MSGEMSHPSTSSPALEIRDEQPACAARHVKGRLSGFDERLEVRDLRARSVDLRPPPGHDTVVPGLRLRWRVFGGHRCPSSHFVHSATPNSSGRSVSDPGRTTTNTAMPPLEDLQHPAASPGGRGSLWGITERGLPTIRERDLPRTEPRGIRIAIRRVPQPWLRVRNRPSICRRERSAFGVRSPRS